MRKILLILLFSLVAAAAYAQQTAISGVVKDESGGVVSGAAVIVRTTAGVERQTVSGPDGRFSIDVPASGDVTLVVRAGGFAEWQNPVGADRQVDVVLKAASLFESVTVTPSRTAQRLGDVPASVSVVDKQTIENSPAVVADDVLRLVPTFSLFRRTSSLTANPTSQGVSLRGIGPSGVSRTLVLLDDIPFNDPFGGWVYWTRVPLGDVDRVEVVEGPSSSVYGNYGMGGVINIVSERPKKEAFELKPQFGNKDTRKLDFSGSDVWGKLGLAVDGSLFGSNGFPTVIANERGPIDNNANTDFKNVNAKADYAITDRVSAFVRAGYFTENRDNGKVSTFAPVVEENNSTRWTTVSGGVRVQMPDNSELQARLFGDHEKYFSNFLAVPASNPPRSLARLTLNQNVPTNSVGGSAQWARPFGTRNYFSAGTDVRWVDGDSIEDAFDAARGQTITQHRVSGGTQTSSGLFAQDIFTPTDKVNITIAMRADHWRNYDAHNLEVNVPSGTPTANNRPNLAEHSITVGSPKIAAMYHFTDRVSAWGSFSTGFRAPTLNELYRQFRVGTVLTLPNENLGPERLVGGELGVNLAVARNATLRSVFFDDHVANPVSNVTIAVTPSQTTQQRQNLGRTRIRGWQNDFDYRLGAEWRISAGYLLDDAVVTEFAANPALIGKMLPQVPKNRGSVSVGYTNDRYVAVTVSGLFYGRQYDDDQNVRTKPGETEPGLPPYATWEMTASHAFGSRLSAFFAVQNVFDTEYYVGLLPTTIGSPRLMTAGLRVRFAGR